MYSTSIPNNVAANTNNCAVNQSTDELITPSGGTKNPAIPKHMLDIVRIIDNIFFNLIITNLQKHLYYSPMKVYKA